MYSKTIFTHSLYGCCGGCYDKHGCQCDHDPVVEVVQVKVVRHVSDKDEDECLCHRVVQVVLNATSEDDLGLGLADVFVGGDGEILLQYLVLNELPAICRM